MHARIGHALGHHRDIRLVAQKAFQHHRRIVDRQGEGETAGALPQGAHDRHHMVDGVGGDPKMPPREGPLAGQQGLCFVLHRKQPRRDAVQLTAGFGRRHVAALAVEQAHAVALLERGHLAREVGLAEAGGAGGGGEGAGFGDEMEGTELGGCHIEETDR